VCVCVCTCFAMHSFLRTPRFLLLSLCLSVSLSLCLSVSLSLCVHLGVINNDKRVCEYVCTCVCVSVCVCVCRWHYWSRQIQRQYTYWRGCVAISRLARLLLYSLCICTTHTHTHTHTPRPITPHTTRDTGWLRLIKALIFNRSFSAKMTYI